MGLEILLCVEPFGKGFPGRRAPARRAAAGHLLDLGIMGWGSVLPLLWAQNGCKENYF